MLTGGEVLSHPDLFRFLDHARDLNLSVQLHERHDAQAGHGRRAIAVVRELSGREREPLRATGRGP